MICADRVVVVTGAGQGLGRAHALAFARAGARLVVNDVSKAAVDAVVAEIGDATGTVGDVADWSYASELVQVAVDAYGRLDVLVNNAGLVRDRMLVNLSEAEWDEVLRVDLKGHAAPLRHAAAYWRDLAKAGRPAQARVINTSSGAGLMGSVGQSNYAAAKAGVAALTQVAAVELARYGVTVNAIAPSALTAMTASVFGAELPAPDDVSPLVVWLGSVESSFVTGRVFEVSGGAVSVADGWQHGTAVDCGRRWDPAELGPVVRDLLSSSPGQAPVYGA